MVAKIEKNLLVTTNNDIWAYYTCPLVNITGQNKEKQEIHKRNLQQFLQGLSKYKDFEIAINPMSFDLEGRLQKLEQDFSEEFEELAENISERTISILENELTYLTTEKLFIAIKLNNVFSAESMRGKVNQMIDQFSARAMASSGFQVEVDQAFFERYQIIEENLFQRVGTLKGRRVTEQELIHLNHYQYVRGMKSALSQSKMIFSDGYSITDAIINPSAYQGLLELRSSEGKSYIGLLPISKFQTNMRFNHIVEYIEELPYPVEFHLKAHFEPLKGSVGVKGKSNRANKRLRNFAKESLEVGEAERKSGKLNRYILNDLDDKIDQRTPILKWMGVFVVFGKTPDECRKRISNVIDYCDSLGVSVERGLADQIYLFHLFLCGKNLGMETNWNHFTTVEGIGEMMIGTDNRIGDNVGFAIGRVSTLNNVSGLKPEQIARSSRKPVFFNPLLANQPDVAGKASSSPHIAITGPTGGGKSFLAKLLFFYCSLLVGKGLYIDPKSEYMKWINQVIENPQYQVEYPLFVDYLKQIHSVTLDANKIDNVGVIDPFLFLEGTDAQDTAETIFEQIYDFKRKEEARTELLRGIKDVLKRKDFGEKVGLMSVVRFMQASKNDEAKAVGDSLYERIDGSILQLAFSEGDVEGLKLDSKVTILEVAGLDMPKAGDTIDKYTSSQRKSIALMMCLGKFCEKFGLSDPDEYTFVLFDEAWIFSSSRGGQQIIKSMRRVGRTYNNMMVLITQSIDDTRTEDDSGNFGRIFAFDNPDEREAILMQVGLENTVQNLDWLKQMPQYHCLYLDIYGRVGRMLVYCPFPEVRESFKTVNANSSGAAEEMYR
jgi:hypothetical protein